MRRSSLVLVVALGLAVALAAPPAGAGADGPRLQILRGSPLTVRGTGFAGAERVRLTVRTVTRTVTQSVRAGADGAFTARFAGVRLGRCGDGAITAVGARGDRARLRRHLGLASCNPG
jgi:hypothetical protein